MNKRFSKPKRFGEILDHTFQLSKNRFTDFMKIFLLLVGPIYLLEAFVQLAAGRSFFREMGAGSGWMDQIFSSFDETEAVANSLGVDLFIILLGILSTLLFMVAQASVLFALDHIRKDESYTLSSVIKKGFSRFWPILGSSILFFFILLAIFIVPIFALVFSGIGIFATGENVVVTIILLVLIGIGLFIGAALLLTRWSFYFASVVLDKESPGFSNSWNLSKKRTWFLVGLYIVFILIIGSITFAVEASFGIFLGNSVLLLLISNLVFLFTTMIFTVGYGIMFFDLKTRNNADDINAMLDDFSEVK